MSQYSVLVIEDDPTFQRFLDYELENAEQFTFRSTFVTTAEEGLECIRRENYDLILLDYFLPGMNGESFLQQLTTLRERPGVICVSESHNYKIAVELLKAGADDYLAKIEILKPYVLQKTILSVIQKQECRKRNIELTISEERLDAIQTMLNTLDHELNNPMAVMKLCSEIINSTKRLTAEDYQTLTQNILSSINRISEVLRKLNHFQTELPNKILAGPPVYELPEVS